MAREPGKGRSGAALGPGTERMLTGAALVKPFPDNENPQASVFNYQGHGLLCRRDAVFGGWQCALCCHLLGTFLLRLWPEARLTALGQSQLPPPFGHPRQQMGWVGASQG